MMMAAWQGHLGCVEILAPLEKGMKDDHWGRSARSWAELNGKQSCVDYLSRFPEE
jgi:ankyrin repeat protein